MELAQKLSYKSNAEYLKKIINQDPDNLSDLLAQLELTEFMTMNPDDQTRVLKAEIEWQTGILDRDLNQFLLNRRSLWFELLVSNPEKAYDIILPVLEAKVNEGKISSEFILTEQSH